MANKDGLALLKKERVKDFSDWVKPQHKKGKKAIDLEDQNLSGLKLGQVDLRGTYLNSGNLLGNDLAGANLKNAKFRSAEFKKANLDGLKGL